MIDFAKETMIPELKRLWHYGFPEDTEYCDFYFDNYFSVRDCIVVSGEKGIETATYMFRGECEANKKIYKAVYWYACATWKEFQRKGNLSLALDFLQKYCIDNNIDIIAVRPVEETFSTYDKRGFSPSIALQRTTAVISETKFEDIVRECAVEDFIKMRGAYLDDYCISWDDKTTQYMYKDICLDGGILTVYIDAAHYYAAYTLYENELLIRETNCPPSDMRRLLYNVCRHIDYSGDVTIYLRCGEELNFEEVKKSEKMYYAHIWINPASELYGVNTDWYINLTAD